MRRSMSEELPLDVLYGEDTVEVADKSISSMYFRCTADAALYLITVDKGVTEVTGYFPEELLATGMMTLMDLVAPESRDELRHNIQQGIGEGKAFASWFVMQRRDESTVRAFIQGKANLSKQLELEDIEGYISANKINFEKFDTYATSDLQEAIVPPPLSSVDSQYVHLLNYATEALGLLNALNEIEYITPALIQLSRVNPCDHQLFTSIFSSDSIALVEGALQEVRQTGRKIADLKVSIMNKEGIPTAAVLFLSPAGSHPFAILFRIKMPQSVHAHEGGTDSHATQSDQTISNELKTLLSVLQKTVKKRKTMQSTKCEGFLTSILYLHDPACRTADGKSITMSVYLGNIAKAYFGNNGNQAIKYEFICDKSLIFDRKIAQACGTVIIELISNSLHHVLERGEAGKISIRILRDQTDGKYLLSVTDTEPAISHTDDAQKSGITVVREIAKSLRGNVKVTSTEHGTKVTMSFPISVRT